MNSDSLWKVIILIICLVLSALFSASETALMSLGKIRVRQMVENKEKGADRIERLLDQPNKLLSSILIGNNLFNIGASSLMTSLAIDAFGNTGVGIATGVMTLLVLIFGEITPKSLAAKDPEKLSLKLGGFINFNMIILTPISFVLSKITNVMIKILGGDIDGSQPFITYEELKTMVGVSHTEGVLEGEEKDMIYNVFEFSDSEVNEVMIPRTELVAINIDLPYKEVIKVITEEQYSRIPVYEDTMDNITGILYVKDLLFLQGHDEDKFDLRKYIRQPTFTYEFKSIKELFKEMRDDRIHMVVVIDEYGGTEGVVTMEDLVEEIVGDIEDEYDSITKDIEVIYENEYIVNGNIKIDAINKLIGTNIESEDFETIAGFIIGLVDKIPDLKEEIEYENIKFIIEDIDRNRIEKIRIIK